MKRRKILVLIPAIGLFLSGCSFSEIKHQIGESWIGQHILHPIYDPIKNLINGGGQKEEKKEDTPTDPTDPTDPVDPVDPTEKGDGTAEHPYSVAEAREAATETAASDTYVTGYIYEVSSYSSQYKSITYWISGDGTGSTANKDGLQIYSGKGLEGADFEAITDLSVGDKVVVKGDLKIYNGTYELDKTNTLISREVPTVSTVTVSGTAEQTEYGVGQPYNHTGLVATAKLSNNVSINVTNVATWAINPETATLGDTEITVTATYKEVASAGFKVAVTVSSSVVPTYHTAEFTKDSYASDASVVQGSNTYPAVKLGNSSNSGVITIKVGENATKLRFYAIGWKSTTQDPAESSAITLTAAAGITITPANVNAPVSDVLTGSGATFTFEASVDLSIYLTEVTLEGISAESNIVLTATRRAVVYGIQYLA